MQEYVMWELPRETVEMLVVLGLAHKAEDGVHELTKEGGKWINDYCQKKIEEHKAPQKHS